MKELKQRRLRRERELQKSSRFRLAKPTTRFFGESAQFHVLSRTGTQDCNSLVLFLNLIQPCRIQLQKRLPTFDEFNEME